MRRSRCALALSLALIAAPARADLYTWTDAQGRVHMSDDPRQVPSGKPVTVTPKPRARTSTRSSVSNQVRNQPASERQEAPRSTLAVAPPIPMRSEAGRVHVLQFQPESHEISLTCELGDRVRVDFKADTGASLNTLPAWAVKELELEIDESTPTISIVGVGGSPMRVPLVIVPSVRIGTVYVENVEMAVVNTMSEGLLGMPFFNRYNVQIDPGQGQLRLTERELEGSVGGYVGYSESQWRMRFAELRKRLDKLRELRDAVPEESETVAQTYLGQLDDEETRVERQLEELERRAREAGVPSNWR